MKIGLGVLGFDIIYIYIYIYIGRYFSNFT